MRTDNLTYKSLDNSNVFKLIQATRTGVDYDTFDKLTDKFPLNISEWSRILNVSERTIQRYKREKKKFDSLHTERLLMIMLLFRKGTDVFGSNADFLAWINSKNVSLGGIKPISLLDNTFGINMVKDELIKIEHGTLA